MRILLTCLLLTAASCGGPQDVPPPTSWPAACRTGSLPAEGPAGEVMARGQGDAMRALLLAALALDEARADARSVYVDGARDAEAYRGWLHRWIYIEHPVVRLGPDRVLLAGELAAGIVELAARDDAEDVRDEVLRLAGAPLDAPPELSACLDALRARR